MQQYKYVISFRFYTNLMRWMNLMIFNKFVDIRFDFTQKQS